MGKGKISIKVVGDKTFERIIGGKPEQLLVSSGLTSLGFINLLFRKYPKMKEIPPARLGFERNGKIPKASQVLKDGDCYEFVVHDDGEYESMTSFDMEILQVVADAGDEGFLVPAGSDEEVMDWLDCAWRRTPCGSGKCPICSRIQQDRRRLVKEGKDPDLIESALDSVAANFAEVTALIKKDAEARGIDITNLDDIDDAPDPESFPLARRVEKWYLSVMDLYKKTEDGNAVWLLTEEALDLGWYAGTFNAKVYRQLCNKWYLDNEKEYGEFDYKYTARVLNEVSKIINKSLLRLLVAVPDFKKLHKEFSLIHKEVKII